MAGPDVGRQFFFEFTVQPKPVADVGKIRHPGFNLFHEGNGLIEREMRQVRGALQGIQYQNFGAAHFVKFSFRNKIQIGQVCEITNPVTKNWQAVVQHINRHHANTGYIKRLIINFMHLNMRNAWVFVFGKHVGEFTLKLSNHPVAGINRDGFLLQKVKRPHIVQARRVVFVFVGKQHSIELGRPEPEHLLPKIGAGINHDARVGDGNVGRRSQPLVAVIE